MPRFCQGDMWSVYDDADLFLITTNSTLKKNGALAMGRGIAQQARAASPDWTWSSAGRLPDAAAARENMDCWSARAGQPRNWARSR